MQRAATVLAGAAALLAAVQLVAWFLAPELVDALSPGDATLQANAAVSIIALAASMLVRSTRMVALLAGFAAITGLLSLLQLPVQDVVSPSIPGRMSPSTAVCLVCVAASRWALHRRVDRLAEALLLVPLAIGALALLGYVLRVERFYTFVAYSRVALTTAAAVVLLSAALALTVPKGVAQWLLHGQRAGATLARHMLPVALIAMPLLAALPIIGLETELFGPRFGVALMVTAAAAVIIGVTAVAVRRLDRIDRKRLAAERRLLRANEVLLERRDEEWRRAEELSRSLGEERARFQRSVAKVDDLIWTVSVQTDGEIRTEYTSGDASGIFGGNGPAVDLRSRATSKLVHPEDRHLLEALDDQIRSGVAAETELRIVGYDGEPRWVWMRGTPRREGDKLFCDGISTNVTDRHLLADRRENVLRLEQEQVRKLKQLNQLREELLAVTGHELRTPLAVVLGYAELLLQDTDLSAVQRQHLEVVAHRARQMALLVDDIFDLAKFSAGLAAIDVEPVRLDEAVAASVEDHLPAAQDAGVTIDVDVTPITVAADPARLRQILDNLLSNAVKYSLPGGTISVATRDGEVATMTVSDGGIGIPEAELEHVFDRMYRASTAKDREIEGTGLGLSVARALVEAHGGTISVRNRPGGGTSFTVELPAHQPS